MPLTLTQDNIVVGDPVEYTIPFGLGQLQLLLLKTHGDKVLQIDAYTGEKITAKQLLQQSICLAQWLQKTGVKVGDAVAVNSKNSIEYTIVTLALMFVGAMYAPLNPDYTSDELRHVLNLSKPKLAFCSLERYNILSKLVNNNSSLEKLIVFSKRNRVEHKNVVMFSDIVKDTASIDVDDYTPVDFDPAETVATVLCSSGTTGLPKGVMTTHKNYTSYLDMAKLRAQNIVSLDGESLEVITLGVAPFFHSMGFMVMYLNLLGGNTMVVMRKFTMQLFLESIAKYKVTTLIIPPPIILLLTKHPLTAKYDLSSIKDVRVGAAPMGRDLEEDLRKKTKLNHISQGYGMTELTLSVAMSEYNNTKPGSVGTIIPGMLGKVVSEEGKNLGPHQEGELCFKGPLVMKGYIGNEKATRDTIDADGWLHTGDIGYYDRDGFIFIVDRMKELIKYKAFQVAPAELEALLLTHPAVADCAVIGLPDVAAGELPMAFVVKNVGVSVTEKEIKDFVAGKVSRQKQLRGGVQFIPEIPKNQAGKILRRVLKQRASANKSKL